MKIRTKLLLVLLVAAVSPVAVSGFYSVAIGRDALEAAALAHQEERAAASAEIALRLVEDSFRGLISSNRYLPLAEFSRPEKVAALRLIYRQFDRFNLVALFDQRGHSIVPAMYSEKPATVPEFRGHEPVRKGDLKRYQKNVPLNAALASGRAIGSVYHSGTGLPRVVLAMRVDVGKKRQPAKGVLTAELSLTTLQERLRTTPGEASSAFLVNNDLAVLVSGNDAVEPGTVLEALSALQDSSEPVARLVEDGEQSLVVGYAPLPALGWGVVVWQPKDVAYAAVATMRNQVLFWTCVSLVIAVLVALFFGQSLARPIAVLLESARSLGRGAFTRIEVRSRDEIGELSITFNEMAGAIEQRDQEIRTWNEELQGRVDAKTRELKDAQDQLLESRKIAAVVGLGAGVAHEINNPLFVIKGMSELMIMKYADQPEIKDMAESTLAEANRIATIVDQLHAMSSASENKRRRRIDFNELISTVLADQETTLGESGISVARDFTEPLPMVSGDRDLLTQVLVQLIDNARQAMTTGGTLTLSTSVIDDEAVRVACADTGAGIPEANLKRVFEPFFTTKTNWSGTGMGLAVARKVVDDHLGSVRIDSTVGEGTTVVMTFPVLTVRAHLV